MPPEGQPLKPVKLAPDVRGLPLASKSPPIEDGMRLSDEVLALGWHERPLVWSDLPLFEARHGRNAHDMIYDLGMHQAGHYRSRVSLHEVLPFDIELLVRLYDRYPSSCTWTCPTLQDMFYRIYGSAIEALEPALRDRARTAYGMRFARLLGRAPTVQYRWLWNTAMQDKSGSTRRISNIISKIHEASLTGEQPRVVLEDLSVRMWALRGLNVIVHACDGRAKKHGKVRTPLVLACTEEAGIQSEKTEISRLGEAPEALECTVAPADVFVSEEPEPQEHLGRRAGEHVAGCTHGHPVKSAAMIRVYALPKDVPTQMQFDAFLLRYMGYDSEKRNPDLIWGIFGTDSMSRANVYASRDASHGGRRLYMMDLWYQIDRKTGGSQSVAENVRATGFVNIQRMDAEYRSYLLSLFLQRLEEENDPEWERLSLERSVDAMVAQRPMLVHWFMERYPWIFAVQHAVHIAPNVMLRIMTLRRDPGRYAEVYVKYHPEIAACVQTDCCH